MGIQYVEKTVNRQTGVRKVQKKKGLFSSDVIEVEEPIYEDVTERIPAGESDKFIDIEDFAKRITDACNDLEKDGYDVVKISEIIEGRYNYAWDRFGGFGDPILSYSYGYGYSVTDGVVIIGKKRE